MPGVGQGDAAYATPLSGGMIAGRLDYQSVGEIAGQDEGEPTGKVYQPSEMLVDVAFSESLGDRFAWGVGVKAVEENLDIDNSQAWGVAVDLGVVLQPGSRQFSYSAYVSNLGTKLSGHTVDERNFGPMPLVFGLTTRFNPGSVRGLALYTDIQQPIDNDLLVRFGFEHRFNQWAEVRGGFRTDLPEIRDAFRTWVLQRQDPGNQPLMDQRWALGGSLHFDQFTLSYGFQWWRLLDAVHSITLSWDLDAPSGS